MMPASNIITSIVADIQKHSSKAILKSFVGTLEEPKWETLTYGEFLQQLNDVASFWIHTLGKLDIPPGCVVGLWITGKVYTDLVHIYGLMRAGYIPQMFGSWFSTSSQDVVNDLLESLDAKVLIHHPSFNVDGVTALHIPLPEFTTIPSSVSTPPTLPEVNQDDMVMAFHTSGTTGNKPKVVPVTHKWLDRQRRLLWPGIWQGEYDSKTQDTFNNLGSYSNIGTATIINKVTYTGSCLLDMSTSGAFTCTEFLTAVKEEGLNRVLLYGPWLTRLFNIVRESEYVLKALQGLRQITYTGASLNPDDEAWAIENKIPLAVMYATTEVANCLVSNLSNPKSLPAMHVIQGATVEFIAASSATIEEANSFDTQLYDMFIPATADNCPCPSIRNRPDGHITGDVFEKTDVDGADAWIFRGRSDDWIQTGPDQAFCDTKNIEDNILTTCPDLVSNCTAVGHYKPALVLFVEPTDPSILNNDKGLYELKAEILTRTKEFNSHRYPHERITDPKHIIVVHPNSLPRTKEKGNIRRKAVEQEFGEHLDKIYATFKTWAV